MTETQQPTKERLLDVGFSLTFLVAIVAEVSLYVVLGSSVIGWSSSRAVIFAFAMYALVRLVIVLFSHALAHVFRSPRPPAHKLSLGQWLKLVAVEYLSLLTLMVILVPFEGLIRLRNPLRSSAVPILFVHGFGCNAGYWWPTIHYLRQCGVDGIETINLGPGFSKIERYSAQLASRIDRICAATQASQVILVAHSMGGLVSRHSLTYPGISARVKHLITLATPHQGTIVARFSPTPDACQMRPDSEFLKCLDESRNRFGCSVAITALLSFDDNVVIPQSNAELTDAHIQHISGVGHLSMSFSAGVHNWLLKRLQALRTGD